MDPAALMAMMNNGGFGGNGGWWWIWIILIFFCWGGFGGNGFGRGSDDASRLAFQLNTDTNTSLLMQAIQGNKDAISSLSNTLNCDINAVQTALNTINTSVSQNSQWTPRMLSSRFPVTRLNRNGIPSLRTISVTTDTTGSAVIYNICPWRWKQLCNEGLMILRISQVPATGSETFVVSINPNSTQNTTVTTTGIPLIGSTGVQLTSADVVNGNRLLVYFNKCEGIFQVVNHIPTTTA